MRVRSSRKPALRWVIPIVALGLVAAGCGGDDTPSATGVSGAVGATSDINPKPRDEIRDGGNLRLAATSFPENWNILQTDADVEVTDITYPLTPRSFVVDAAGELSINHDYFTDVQLTNTNPQQVTYTINPKAKWSDGNPITWEDLASQANALSTKDPRFLVGNSGGFERVAKVERGVDDQQAIFTFDKPYADWKGHFAGLFGVLPKSVTANPDSFNKSLADHMGLTAGPFRIRSADRSTGLITLERDPNWWGEQPKLDTVTWRVLDRSAWTQAIQNNELDAALLSTIDDVKTARSSAGVTVRRAPGNRWRHFTFNGAPGSIMADPQLRVAISKAIDRQGIAMATQNGMVENPRPLNNHVYLEGQVGYQDNAAAVAYDPAAAARMLDELGWKLNGDVREKDGRKLEIRDVMYNDPTWVQIAQIIQQNLSQVGVKLTIDTKPAQGYFSDIIIPGDFDVAHWSWIGDPFAFGSLSQIWGVYPDNVQGNYGRIGSPEINALIEQTQSELDPQKARDLANQIDRMVFEEGHSLPLTQNEGNWAVRADLANFGAPGLANYDYTLIGYTK